MPFTPQNQKAVEVFYSYSHKDEALRNELENHLVMLKRAGMISSWHDRKIGAGKEWAGEIDRRLNTADIILLLISPDFLASEYCYDIELKRAMERHAAGEACVIPVILRACDWSRARFSALQSLPRNAVPVKKWKDRDEAFLNIAEGIGKVVEEINASRAAEEIPYDSAPRAGGLTVNPKHLYLVPYLCDRSEQETSLEEALRQHPAHRPIFCVIHGEEQECHDMFLLRLLRVFMPELLGLKPGTVLEERFSMAWPAKYTPSRDPLDSFRGGLSKVLGCDSRASKEEMASILAREHDPVVIHSNLLTSNWESDGRELIESFIRCWSEWPDLPPQRTLVVCILLKYEQGRERNFWEKWRLARHNKELRRFFGGLTFDRSRLTGVVLPELRAVNRADVEHWVHSHARRVCGDEFTADFFVKINSIFAGCNAIEMEKLAAHLREMIRQR